MDITFPANCKTDPDQWSYLIERGAVLLEWHNAQCASMSKEEARTWRKENYDFLFNETAITLGVKIIAARNGSLLNPRIPDHARNGEIYYPQGLDQSNKGEKGFFLKGLQHKLDLDNRDMYDDDWLIVSNTIYETKEEIKLQRPWGITIEDILNAS